MRIIMNKTMQLSLAIALFASVSTQTVNAINMEVVKPAIVGTVCAGLTGLGGYILKQCYDGYKRCKQEVANCHTCDQIQDSKENKEHLATFHEGAFHNWKGKSAVTVLAALTALSGYKCISSALKCFKSPSQT